LPSLKYIYDIKNRKLPKEPIVKNTEKIKNVTYSPPSVFLKGRCAKDKKLACFLGAL
jgi:hypothetical protein